MKIPFIVFCVCECVYECAELNYVFIYWTIAKYIAELQR